MKIIYVALIILSSSLLIDSIFRYYFFFNSIPTSAVQFANQQVSDFRFLNKTQLKSLGIGHLTFSVPPWIFAHDRNDIASSVSEAAISDADNYKAQDGEDYFAIKHFFRNHGRGGLILESGALDGRIFSTSWAFEKVLGWRAIHIEANPHTYSDLVKIRPDALNINAALCREPQTVHLIYDEEKKPVGGIWEFMSVEFKKRWWSEVRDINLLPSVMCTPLAPLLQLFDISHVNFWVLDVEGAELEVLQATDFDRVTFDVIAMENLGLDMEKDFATVSFLEKKGYVVYATVLRNVWLVSDKMALTLDKYSP
jgi:FkbM family methyltransferase